MGKYLDKELFLSSMGLAGDETKYGNRDSEHQQRSYSTWMAYEIMDSVEDSEVDAVPVVHGQWIHDINNLFGCSVCGERETMSARKPKNYCPNCGAKMDGVT